MSFRVRSVARRDDTCICAGTKGVESRSTVAKKDLDFDTLSLDDECKLQGEREKQDQSKHRTPSGDSSIKSAMISIVPSPIILIYSSSLLRFPIPTS